MKMNIKGLVFVGFAAAVFASAANAADKVVTSKQYVDGKIVQTLTDGDTTHAPSADKVHDELALKQNIHISDNSADHGKTLIVGDTGDITISDVSAVDDTNTTYTISSSQTTDGSITVTPSEGDAYDVAVPGLAAAAYKAVDTTISDDNATSTNLPTTQAVYNFATSADRQSNWAQSDSAKPDYIKNKPGNFGGATAAGAGSAGFVPAPAAGDQGKVLGGNGQWVEVDGTPYEQGTGITIDDHTIINAGVRQVTATPSTGTDGTISVNTNGTVAEVAVKGLQGAAYKTAETTISTTAADNTDAEVPTAKAVYDFVTAQTGDVLPDNPTGENEACSTTNPCALVWDGSATGPEWKRIQQ